MKPENSIFSDKKENPKHEMKKYQTDSSLTTKSEKDSSRKHKLQDRLIKAKQKAKKREEENKYKQSDEIKSKAKQLEGKISGNGDDEQK